MIYTYQSHDIDATWDLIDSVPHIPPAPVWPTVNFEQSFKAMMFGVPLAGHFSCSFQSVTKQNLYNNHAKVKPPEVASTIQAKFIKEEELT